MRLDIYLAENGLAKSRSFAKELICGGYVTVDGKTVLKPSAEAAGVVAVTGRPYEYVSRGGVKLAAALDSFGISPDGAVCVDIGASSGGFTDCLLRRGAKKVFAVDSGTNQLDSSLREDNRVVSIENFNARSLVPETLGESCSVAVTDVSFISQTLIIPVVPALLSGDGIYISLIKPQFECGKSALSKGGIVRDRRAMREALRKVIASADSCGLGAVGLIQSPVTGGDGNTEFLMWAQKGKNCAVSDEMIREVCSN